MFWAKKDNKLCYIDKSGNLILTPEFEDGSPFFEGLAGVTFREKWGFINEKGEAVIKPQFDDIHYFSEGYCGVSIKDKWGLIDTTGNLIVKLKYHNVGNVQCKIVGVEIDNEKPVQYFTVPDKKKICESTSASIHSFSEDLLVCSDTNYLWGYRNVCGEWVIPAKYASAYHFSEGLAEVSRKGDKKELTGFINRNGDEVLPFIYSTAAAKFSCGLAVACRKTKGEDFFGAINKKGEWVIEPKLNYLSDFCEGLARFEDKGKSGYIDTNGNVVINAKYDVCWPFQNGIALVKLKKDLLYINKKDEVIFKFS
jgi:hypothetical protein